MGACRLLPARPLLSLWEAVQLRMHRMPAYRERMAALVLAAMGDETPPQPAQPTLPVQSFHLAPSLSFMATFRPPLLHPAMVPPQQADLPPAGDTRGAGAPLLVLGGGWMRAGAGPTGSSIRDEAGVGSPSSAPMLGLDGRGALRAVEPGSPKRSGGRLGFLPRLASRQQQPSTAAVHLDIQGSNLDLVTSLEVGSQQQPHPARVVSRTWQDAGGQQQVERVGRHRGVAPSQHMDSQVVGMRVEVTLPRDVALQFAGVEEMPGGSLGMQSRPGPPGPLPALTCKMHSDFSTHVQPATCQPWQVWLVGNSHSCAAQWGSLHPLTAPGAVPPGPEGSQPGPTAVGATAMEQTKTPAAAAAPRSSSGCSSSLWDSGSIRLWCLRATARESLEESGNGAGRLLQQIAASRAQPNSASPALAMSVRMQQLLQKLRQRAQHVLLLKQDCPGDVPDLILLMLPAADGASPGAAFSIQMQLAAYDSLVQVCASLGVLCTLTTAQPHVWEQLLSEHHVSTSSGPPVLAPMLVGGPSMPPGDHMQLQLNLLLSIHSMLSSTTSRMQDAKL